MASRHKTKRRTFLNVEVDRAEKEAVREMAKDRAASLGLLRISLSDMTREILRQAVAAHREKKTPVAA